MAIKVRHRDVLPGALVFLFGISDVTTVGFEVSAEMHHSHKVRICLEEEKISEETSITNNKHVGVVVVPFYRLDVANLGEEVLAEEGAHFLLVLFRSRLFGHANDGFLLVVVIFEAVTEAVV